MNSFRCAGLLAFFLIFGLAFFTGCGDGNRPADDNGDQNVCEQAFEITCACPDTTCEGEITSCIGPDKEDAECILAATDPCDAPECI